MIADDAFVLSHEESTYPGQGPGISARNACGVRQDRRRNDPGPAKGAWAHFEPERPRPQHGLGIPRQTCRLGPMK